MNGFVFGVQNFMFYGGIYALAVAYRNDVTDISVLICFIPIILGMLLSAIPNAMVTQEVLKISRKVIYAETFLREISFIFVCVGLDINFNITCTIICIAMLVDILLGIRVLYNMNEQRVSIMEYLLKPDKEDNSLLWAELKYIWINFVFVCFFMYVHESLFEIVITFSACIIYFGFMIIRSIREKYYILFYLITIIVCEVLMLVLAYYRFNIAVCVVFGYQLMFMRDMLYKKRHNKIINEDIKR